MKINKRTVYISLFTILYLAVALVSTLHAVSFFSLANNMILGIILAIAFEIGQAAVLFAILTSSKDRSKVMPWILMGILTLVQILGNVYSSYRYLITNSQDLLVYFKDPIFVWTSIPDNVANVIITYIVGGILPIVALCMTSMVTGYLEDNNEDKVKEDIKVDNEVFEEPIENKIEENIEDNKDNIEKESKIEEDNKEEVNIDNNKNENKSRFINL